MIMITIRFLKKFKKVKLCLDGKLKYKPIKDVQFTLACNGIQIFVFVIYLYLYIFVFLMFDKLKYKPIKDVQFTLACNGI